MSDNNNNNVILSALKNTRIWKIILGGRKKEEEDDDEQGEKRKNENKNKPGIKKGQPRVYHDGNRWCAHCRQIRLEAICLECHRKTRGRPKLRYRKYDRKNHYEY